MKCLLWSLCLLPAKPDQCETAARGILVEFRSSELGSVFYLCVLIHRGSFLKQLYSPGVLRHCSQQAKKSLQWWNSKWLFYLVFKDHFSFYAGWYPWNPSDQYWRAYDQHKPGSCCEWISADRVSVHGYYCPGMRLHIPAATRLLETQNHPHLSSESRVLQLPV